MKILQAIGVKSPDATSIGAQNRKAVPFQVESGIDSLQYAATDRVQEINNHGSIFFLRIIAEVLNP